MIYDPYLHNLNRFEPIKRDHWQARGLELCLKAVPHHRGTTWYDLSGKNRHAALVNGPTWGVGSRGPKLGFDGSNDYVVASDSLAFTPSSSGFTAVCEFRTASTWQSNATQTRFPILVKGPLTLAELNSGMGFEWFLFGFVAPAGTPKLEFITITSNGNTNSQAASSDSMAYQTTYHAAGVMSSDGGTKLYVNGLLDGSGSAASLPSDTPSNVIVGRNFGASTEWKSACDVTDIRIYSRALSADEIAEIYEDSYSQRYELFNRRRPLRTWYFGDVPAWSKINGVLRRNTAKINGASRANVKSVSGVE